MKLRLFWTAAAAAVAAGVAAASAGGYPYSVSSPALITGPSPYSACAIGATQGGVVYTNAEVEPQVAVDPVTGNTVANWQQDRWSDGSARALGTAVSPDGGLSWGGQFFLPWSLCAGGAPPAGDFPRVTDPWVSFGPDGIGYQVALGSYPYFPFRAESAITASRSLDGGLSWEAPQVILRERFASAPFPINDKESVTADPTGPGFAYAVWDRVRFPSEQEALQGAFHSYFEAYSFRGDAMLSRTTDGGASWEPARSIMPTNANVWTIGNQIAVTGDRTLVDVFEFSKGSGIQPSGQQGFGALRSTDAGQSWSRIVEIADAELVLPPSGSGRPPSTTSSEPRIRNSIALLRLDSGTRPPGRLGAFSAPLAAVWRRFGPWASTGVMHTKPQEALMDDPSAVAGQAVASGSATIERLVARPSALAVAATGSYANGIGRVDFVLVDLTGDALDNVVDRKDVDYAKAPTQVSEAWDSSVALTPERPYRLFFHVYDRTGVNLVAYDRRDFTCESKGA